MTYTQGISSPPIDQPDLLEGAVFSGGPHSQVITPESSLYARLVQASGRNLWYERPSVETQAAQINQICERYCDQEIGVLSSALAPALSPADPSQTLDRLVFLAEMTKLVSSSTVASGIKSIITHTATALVKSGYLPALCFAEEGSILTALPAHPGPPLRWHFLERMNSMLRSHSFIERATPGDLAHTSSLVFDQIINHTRVNGVLRTVAAQYWAFAVNRIMSIRDDTAGLDAFLEPLVQFCDRHALPVDTFVGRAPGDPVHFSFLKLTNGMDHFFRYQLFAATLKNITMLDAHSANSARLLFDTSHLIHFGRYPVSLLIQQAEALRDGVPQRVKPFGCFVSGNDWNGALYRPLYVEALQQRADGRKHPLLPLFAEAEDRKTFTENHRFFTGTFGALAGSVISGHGSPESFRLGDNDTLVPSPDLAQWMSELFQETYRTGATVVLNACSLAASGPFLRLLQEVADRSGVRFIGSAADGCTSHFRFLRGNSEAIRISTGFTSLNGKEDYTTVIEPANPERGIAICGPTQL